MLVFALPTSPISDNRLILPAKNSNHIFGGSPLVVTSYIMAFPTSPRFSSTLGNKHSSVIQKIRAVEHLFAPESLSEVLGYMYAACTKRKFDPLTNLRKGKTLFILISISKDFLEVVGVVDHLPA
jgi:hypothetical protein